MMHLDLTVNLVDGTEQDFAGEVTDFTGIRDFLNDQMGRAGLAPDTWSSFVLTLVAPVEVEAIKAQVDA